MQTYSHEVKYPKLLELWLKHLYTITASMNPWTLFKALSFCWTLSGLTDWAVFWDDHCRWQCQFAWCKFSCIEWNKLMLVHLCTASLMGDIFNSSRIRPMVGGTFTKQWNENIEYFNHAMKLIHCYYLHWHTEVLMRSISDCSGNIACCRLVKPRSCVWVLRYHKNVLDMWF